jgi:uncharacterized protein YsxB (DUF464 family)
MESVIVLGLMVLILEVREFQARKRISELESLIIEQSNLNAKTFSSSLQLLESFTIEFDKLSNQSKSVIESVNEFKTDLEHLSKEYELRIRTDRNDTGPIDGVIGL